MVIALDGFTFISKIPCIKCTQIGTMCFEIHGNTHENLKALTKSAIAVCSELTFDLSISSRAGNTIAERATHWKSTGDDNRLENNCFKLKTKIQSTK